MSDITPVDTTERKDVSCDSGQETAEKSVNESLIRELEGDTIHPGTFGTLTLNESADDEKSHQSTDDDALVYSPFSPMQKKIMVVTVSLCSMLSSFAATVFLPALRNVAEDLDSSLSRINFTVSVFLIGNGIAPMVWGPIADQFGRRFPYSVGSFIGAAASVGCAVANSDSLLIAMRFFQSFGGSSTMVVGAGTISDIYEPHQRGSALGWYYSGQMLGPTLGTIIGGYVAETLGWRWTFWLTAIIYGISFIVLTFIQPETMRVAVARKRKMPLKGLPPGIHLQPRLKFDIRRVKPFEMMPTLKLPYVWIPTVGTSLLIGAYYSISIAISILLSRDYGYSPSTIGLCFIAFGGGNVFGATIGGSMADYTFVRKCRQLKSVPEENRVPSTKEADDQSFHDSRDLPFERRFDFNLFTFTLFPMSLIAYGWLMQYKVHIVFPLILEFICGFCSVATFGTFTTYLVDLFTARSSSITSLTNLFRCLYGAVWTGILNIVMQRMGTGWTFTFMGFTVFIGTALLVTLYRKGASWRQKYPPHEFTPQVR
ncbi:hypothetical protein IWQ62_001760 [Dispira parvispora]|uniref:Major facilitator superfamily (MFS) profile domain-containing protein n=1 Tax=Dispira parvispora TaxID=1520584 RepID=A0A9W8E8Q4_9FUNG|nr:hypothetical protein IWQ62_001760 [Dispira parvispora]